MGVWDAHQALVYQSGLGLRQHVCATHHIGPQCFKVDLFDSYLLASGLDCGSVHLWYET